MVTTSKKTKEKTTKTTTSKTITTPNPPTTTTESDTTSSSEIPTGSFGNLPTNLTTSGAPHGLQGRPCVGLIEAIVWIVMFLYEK